MAKHKKKHHTHRNPIRFGVPGQDTFKNIGAGIAGAAAVFFIPKLLKLDPKYQIVAGFGITLLGGGLLKGLIGSKAAEAFVIGSGATAGIKALNQIGISQNIEWLQFSLSDASTLSPDEIRAIAQIQAGESIPATTEELLMLAAYGEYAPVSLASPEYQEIIR